MNWEIRRTVSSGQTVALDIVENGALMAGVTIRGDIAKAEKRATRIAAVNELVQGCGSVTWIANNLHLYGTPEFLEFLTAACKDAKSAYRKATGEIT